MATICSKMARTRMGAMPSEGSSSIRQLRLAHQRAGDGQHLLLAAGKRARQLADAFLEPRENGEDVVDVLGDARLVIAQVGAHAEVFLHGEIGEDHAALRHVAEAARPRSHARAGW